MGMSLKEQIARLSPSRRQAWLDRQSAEALHDALAGAWWFTARPEQLAPSSLDWTIWLILAGRGFGKTRSGAEWLVPKMVGEPSDRDGAPTEWAIVGETFGEAKTVCVEGPSGLLRVMHRLGYVRGRDYQYNRSSWQINFDSGQRLHMLGADDPDAGRGLNLAGLWADEIAKWRYPDRTWDEGIAPALRIGRNPQACITTTPKPLPLLKDWVLRDDGSVAVTRGTTFDNAANLSRRGVAELRKRYSGTRMGRQELYGDLLLDIEGALFRQTWWDRDRVSAPPVLQRTVIGVDPAASGGETGLVALGQGRERAPDLMGNPRRHLYVLEDQTKHYSHPSEWAREAVAMAKRWNADIVAEVNQGGDMVAATIAAVDKDVRVIQVRASKGKAARAEPVAAIAEQGGMHAVGRLQLLEEQTSIWVEGRGMPSPDRMDALVWAAYELDISKSTADLMLSVV
ncbi:Terminase-like family protein [compost metagenome]